MIFNRNLFIRLRSGNLEIIVEGFHGQSTFPELFTFHWIYIMWCLLKLNQQSTRKQSYQVIVSTNTKFCTTISCFKI